MAGSLLTMDPEEVAKELTEAFESIMTALQHTDTIQHGIESLHSPLELALNAQVGK